MDSDIRVPEDAGATAFVAILQPDVLRREGRSGGAASVLHGHFHMKLAVILNICGQFLQEPLQITTVIVKEAFFFPPKFT